jgi:hypothetical protein
MPSTVVLEPTPELLKIASRVVWFDTPDNVLKQPSYFLAALMTHGLAADVLYVLNRYGLGAFAQALQDPPVGVFDARSWTYWHLRCGMEPVPPLPVRNFPT